MERVQIADITETDLKNLQKALSVDPDRPRLDSVLREIATGVSQLWRHRGLVIVTEEHKESKALFVTWVGGLGTIKDVQPVFDELKTIARKNGLQKIDTVAVRSGIGLLLEQAGAREVARRYVLEV